MNTQETRRAVRIIQPTVKIKNKNIDLSPYVRVIETYKSLKQPAGTFFIEISPANTKDNISSYNISEQMYNNIDPMDIIEIGISEPGLMVALIDSPNKNKGIGMDNFTRKLQITGRDFAKLLIEDSIIYSPQLADNKFARQILGEERLAFIGHLGRAVSSTFNNPICALLFVLRNIPSTHIEVPFTDMSDGNKKDSVNSGKLGQYFICDLKAFLGDKVTNTNISQFSAKIWNFLKLCIDENFYEMYVDTVMIKGNSGDEARPCLFLRPKPYDRTTDDVIKIKDVYPSGAPVLQAMQAVASVIADVTGSDVIGQAKAMAASADVMKNLINFNKVIYPRIERGDISITKSGADTGSASQAQENISSPGNALQAQQGGGVTQSSSVTTNVAISGMDKNGNVPDPVPPQFSGQRDVNNPDDSLNKSMVIPWTWDGNDSFFRTLVTNEPFHTIHDDDIIQEIMGVTDEEVIDFITIRSRKDLQQDSTSTQLGFPNPLMDAYKIQKFGLRAFNVESNLLHSSYTLTASEAQNYTVTKSDKKDIFSSTEYVNNRERIFNWYRYNDIFESGIVVIKGNQNIRIGDKIYMPDAISKGRHKGIYAYVQGVKNRFEYTANGVKFETTLELIRGENPDDIQEYRSKKNSGTGNNLKLGTTYRNYDDSLGQMFNGNPEDPSAHNIIKFDTVKNISDLDVKNKDVQKPANEPPNSNDYSDNPIEPLVPKFSGYISPDVETSKQTLSAMQLSENSPLDISSVSTQIENGEGTNANPHGAETVTIDPRIFQFLEAIGSSGFPFKMSVLTIVDSQKYNIENDEKKQVSPSALGKAVEIKIEGSGGSPDYIKRTTALLTYILGIQDNGNNTLDNPLKTLLNSRGVMPKYILTCPNQNDSEDLKLCLGITEFSDKIKTEFKSKIQFVF